MTQNYQDEVLTYVLDVMEHNHVPTHIIVPGTGEGLFSFDRGLRNVFTFSEKYEKMILEQFSDMDEGALYMVTDEFECAYCVMQLPDSMGILVCGPFTYEHIEGDRLMEILKRRGIPGDLHDHFRDYYLDIAYIAMPAFFTSMFAILAEHFFGHDGYRITSLTLGEMEDWQKYYANRFKMSDDALVSIQMIEDRYEAENQMIAMVESGDEARAMGALAMFRAHSIPTRINNVLRDAKDYCLALNTLLRKAAERAGVHPIHIDNLSNLNVQKAETAASIEQCEILFREFTSSYCRLIRRHTLHQYSPLTQKVVTYVATDIGADLSLKNFAEMLSVNASYLSTLFHREMGTSLTDYVNRTRIRHAQHLLLETDLPIKIIAQKCGVSDIYYFGHLFKRITGTSPKAYRENRSENALALALSSGGGSKGV